MCARARACARSEETTEQGGDDAGIRGRERRNKNTMVRSPIGSVVPRHRPVHAHLSLFLSLFFSLFFPQSKGAPIRWRWWPCARWSRILSQGQSVSRIRRLSFVSFLFHHRARRDTAAKKAVGVFSHLTQRRIVSGFWNGFIPMEPSDLLKSFCSLPKEKKWLL